MYTKLGWVIGLTCCSVAAAGEWHVDDDLVDNPNADFATIQEAVDAAADFDTIYVSPGTYTSNADAVITITDKYVVLRATGDADQTIIDGQNLRRGIVIEEDSDGLFMVGFTITHCQTPDTGGATVENGAAILASSALVELYGCNIVSNSATGGQWSSAAIYCDDVDLGLEGCSMSANVANYGPAGINAFDSNVTCRHSDFTNHQLSDSPHGNGDVIHVNRTTPDGPTSLVLSQCSFTSNTSTRIAWWTGLVYCDGDVDCSSTTFRNNSGNAIFKASLKTSGTFVDCVIDGNTATGGGAVVCIVGNHNAGGDTPVEIGNCEFLGNQSLGWGGGLFLAGAAVTMSGCQFKNNTSGTAGGGLSMDNAHSIDISDTTFLTNTVTGNFGGSAASFSFMEVTPSLVRVEVCGNTGSWSQISGDWEDAGDTCIMTICDPIPDGRIGVHDLLTVLERYGESCEACTELQVADLNGDFVVDMLDIEALIADWGDTCAL